MHTEHEKELCYLTRGAGIAQSVQQLATDRTVRGLNPGGGEIYHTSPDRL